MMEIFVRAPAAPQPAVSQAPEPDAVSGYAYGQNMIVVLFQLGNQQYGLPLAVVHEIVRLPALIMLAGAPPALCGLLNLRGQHLPVLNGRVLVGEPALYDLNSQIVIAGRGWPELGLLVDQVHDVYTVAADRIRPINRPDVAPFLISVCNLADGSVLLFDLPALLASAHEVAKPKTKRAARRREPR
ncbi:MAG: chemotaxis protein CheW [Roseiflexaceae bacterium]